MLPDGDGEADIHLAADRDDGVGIEAAVGPHREWSPGPSVAHPSHRFTREVGGAPNGVGPALAQSRHQHVAGAGGDGQQRMIAPLAIAPLAGVVVAAGSFLGQPVGLADGGVQVDGQRPVARASPGGPGPCQQLPAHSIQLTDLAPPEAAQEGPQRGWRLDHAAQNPCRDASRPTGAQHVGVVNAVAPSQPRGHQGQRLVSRVRMTRRISQINVAVHQFTQTQALGQGDRKEQPGIGHQTVVVEGDADAVGVLKWWHLLGAPRSWLVSCVKKPLSPKRGSTFLPLQHDATIIFSVDRGLGEWHRLSVR